MAIGSITPFRPTGTVSLSAGTLSAAVALAGGGDSVVVTNASASLAYVAFGADQSATASSCRYAGDGELTGSAVREQPGKLCGCGADGRQRRRAVHAWRRILCLMAFTDSEKSGHSSLLRLSGLWCRRLGLRELAVLSGLRVTGIPYEQPF